MVKQTQSRLFPARAFQRARGGLGLDPRRRSPAAFGRGRGCTCLPGGRAASTSCSHTRPSQAILAAASTSRGTTESVVASLGGEGCSPLVPQAHCWARCRAALFPSSFPFRYPAPIAVAGRCFRSVLICAIGPVEATKQRRGLVWGRKRCAQFLGRRRFCGGGLFHLSRLRDAGCARRVLASDCSSGSHRRHRSFAVLVHPDKRGPNLSTLPRPLSPYRIVGIDPVLGLSCSRIGIRRAPSPCVGAGPRP